MATLTFTAHSTASTITVTFGDGREVAVANGNAPDLLSQVAADTVRANYPNGTASVSGEITVSATVA
jgi:hypothetical protein